MLSQEITQMSHNESIKTLCFFFGCQIKKWLCECINIFRWHSECTKRSTLILTPNEDSQGLLICIAIDETYDISYYSKTCCFAAIWFNQINVSSPISKAYVYIVWLLWTLGIPWCRQHQLMNRNIPQRVSWVAIRIRSLV